MRSIATSIVADNKRKMADVSWDTTDTDKLSKFMKTPTKKKSLDDLGSSVLARLRAKRRKYNSEKELLTKLQAMEKDATMKVDPEWATALKKQIQKLSANTLVDKKTSAEANRSLLLYFPPSCATKETPGSMIAGDLPLAPPALQDESASIKVVLAEAETAFLKAQMEAETLSPQKIVQLESNFHKIMSNVVTVGDHTARLRGFLKLAEVPVQQLVMFKSKAYNGTTLLMQMAKLGRAACTALLIDEFKADVHEQSVSTRDTALHFARRNEHHQVAEALLQRGADENTTNLYGEDARRQT